MCGQLTASTKHCFRQLNCKLFTHTYRAAVGTWLPARDREHKQVKCHVSSQDYIQTNTALIYLRWANVMKCSTSPDMCTLANKKSPYRYAMWRKSSCHGFKDNVMLRTMREEIPKSFLQSYSTLPNGFVRTRADKWVPRKITTIKETASITEIRFTKCSNDNNFKQEIAIIIMTIIGGKVIYHH